MWTNLGRSWNKTGVQRMTEATPRMTQNSLKSLPGGTLRHPKSIPALSPSTLDRRKNTWWPKVGQKVAKVGRKSVQRGQSGTQVGPQNRQKNDPERKKRSPRWRRKRFSSISCAISVRSEISDRFWEGLNLQNPIISTVGARFSQNHGFHIFLEF